MLRALGRRQRRNKMIKYLLGEGLAERVTEIGNYVCRLGLDREMDKSCYDLVEA
jgi:hypothetical protein